MTYHVVTPVGAVSVPKKVFDEISKIRTSGKPEGDLILYTMAFPDKLTFSVEGTLPSVTTLEEFTSTYMANASCPRCGRRKRNLIL